MRRPTWLLIVLFVPLSLGQGTPDVQVHVVEVVADPQSDWDGDGRVTSSDEFVEILASEAIDLAGWTLILNDTTPTTLALTGWLEAGVPRFLVNPPGEINNNGHVALADPTGRAVDGVRFGTWPGAAGVPDANANDARDEALRLVAGTWSKGHATPGAPPLEPFALGTNSLMGRDGSVWTPGNTTESFALDWTDAGRSYVDASLRMSWGNVTNETHAPFAFGAGRGAAHINATTPSHDFDIAWVLRGSDNSTWERSSRRVRVDASPPPAPLLGAPVWAGASGFRATVTAVEDEGVGGVEYAVETAQDGTNWTVVAPWNATPPNVALHAATSVRALARDAFGNVATGDARWVALDADPPTVPPWFEVAGYRTTTLRWKAPDDAASGIASLRMDRVWPGHNRTWLLDANTTEFEDVDAGLGVKAEYALRAIDGAGNVGNASWALGEREGLHPHVFGMRVNRPVWGAGALRVWVDFDRAMDPESMVEVTQGIGGTEVALSGRWLANHTTWSIVVDADDAPQEGPARFAVRAVTGPAGHALWAPAFVTVLADTSPPTVETSGVDGWVNATGLVLRVHDSLDPGPILRFRIGNETTWTERPSMAVVPVEGALRVEVLGVDWAGRRSTSTARTFRSDVDAPFLQLVAEEPGRVGLRAGDNGSGLAGIEARTASNTSVAMTREADVHWIEGAGEYNVSVRDRVGNVLTRRFHVAFSSPSSTSNAAVSGNAAAADESGRGPAQGVATPPTHVVKTLPAPPGGLGALATVAAAAFARRRRPYAS